MIIALIILIVLGLVGYYFIIEKDILGLEKDKTEIVEVESLNINKLEEQIFSKEGIVSYNNKTVNFNSYEGKSWNLELTEIIDKVYIYDYIYILSKDRKKLTEVDLKGNIISSNEFEEEILDVKKEEIVFLIARSEDESNIIIKILNNGEIIKNIIDGNIVVLSPKNEIDSYFISYFNFNEGAINSTIQQRLIEDDIKLWENTLVNEIAVEAFKTSSRTFILTDKNFYAFNTDGIILWKYSNFETIKDIEIDKENGKIYLLESNRLHSLEFDSTVLNIVDLDQNYNELKTYNDNILLSNNTKIDELKEEMHNIWENDEILVDYHINNGYIYIETDYNTYKGKLITGR